MMIHSTGINPRLFSHSGINNLPEEMRSIEFKGSHDWKDRKAQSETRSRKMAVQRNRFDSAVLIWDFFLKNDSM